MELVRRTLKRISRSLPPDYCSNEFSIRAERGAFPPSPSSLNAPHEETSPEEEAQQSPVRRSRAPSREIPELEIPTNSSRAINALPTPESSEIEDGIAQHSGVEQIIKREEEEESLRSNGSEERGDDNYTIAGTSNASEMSDDASDATCNSTPPRQPGRVYTRVPMQRNGTQRSMAEMNRYNNMDIYGQRTMQAQERQILAAERALRLAQHEADIARRTLAERRVDVVAATQRLAQLGDEMHTLRARAPQHWAAREVIPRHVAARAQPAPGSLRPRPRPRPQVQNNHENNSAGEENAGPVAGPSHPPPPRVQPPSPSINSLTSRAPSPAPLSTGSNKRTRGEDGEPAADDAESDHSGSAGRRTRIRLEDAASPAPAPVHRPLRRSRRAVQPTEPVRRSARLRDVASRNRALEAEASVSTTQHVEASQPTASSSRVADDMAGGSSSEARGRKRSRDQAEDAEDGESDGRKGKGKESKRRRR